MICGIEQYGIFWSRMCSISALPREVALPMTARSGAGFRFSSRKPSFHSMPRELSSVEAGGYTFTSEPVTRKPLSFNIPATGAMADPAIPSRWMCSVVLKVRTAVAALPRPLP